MENITEFSKRSKRMGSNVIGKRIEVLPSPPPDAICRSLNIHSLSIDWLAGDGSDRCYYRIQSPELKHSLVLMQLSKKDAHLIKDHGYEWIKIGNLLNHHAIPVPKLVTSLYEYAALIIEDYGDMMLETITIKAWQNQQKDRIKACYDKAFDLIAKMLAIPFDADHVWTKRAFDQERLSWELRFFEQQFFDKAIHQSLPSNEKEQFLAEVEHLASYLASFSKYFTHRDYHSRNLMLFDERLAVIDFQDARLGAPAYDAVSLCFDSYVPFDKDFRMQLLGRCQTRIRAVSDKAAKEFSECWQAVLLQRQLKAIGSFAYLTVSKNRGNYLHYVKPAIETLLEAEVFDARWPFLSSDLLGKIAKFV